MNLLFVAFVYCLGAVKRNSATTNATKKEMELELRKWFGNARDRGSDSRKKARLQSLPGSATSADASCATSSSSAHEWHDWPVEKLASTATAGLFPQDCFNLSGYNISESMHGKGHVTADNFVMFFEVGYFHTFISIFREISGKLTFYKCAVAKAIDHF